MNMNIYITKDNTDFLRGEFKGSSMSGLINELIRDYRNLNQGVSALQAERKDKLRPVMTDKADNTQVAPEGVLAPVPIQPSFHRLANGLCKIHGVPLTAQGKCLQKGCKYA